VAKRSISKVKPSAPAKKRTVFARRGVAKHAQRAAEKLYEMNPSGLAGFSQMALPAFGAYAATRFVSRVTYVQLSPRTKFAHHLSVGASAGVTLLAWLAGEHISSLKKYDSAILLGSSVATLQALLQTYVPKFGWIVSDHLPPPGMAVMRNGQHRLRTADGGVRQRASASALVDDFGVDDLEPIPAGEPGSLLDEDLVVADDDFGSLGGSLDDVSGGSLGYSN